MLFALRRRCPQLPEGLSLTDSLAELRRGRFRPAGTKVVIFLDQFEQWLHANRDVERPELAAAMRQCDGVGVQCVLMVRDDFWMAVTRFMHDLQIRLVQGQNCSAVDLFSPPHARKVLSAFGHAFGALEETGGAPSAAEGQFLDRAVARRAGHSGSAGDVRGDDQSPPLDRRHAR